MRILIAEDEETIATTYELGLVSQGHEVTITSNGQVCVEAFDAAYRANRPFDIVILDYRMPKMDGYAAAIKILDINPDQRIIFASAYAKETLVELVTERGMIAELLQKPFDLQVLFDAVEDKELYGRLKELQINIGDLKSWNPGHRELSDLYDALMRLKDAKTIFQKLQQGRPNYQRTEQGPISNDSRLATALIEDALEFLGPDWLLAFYYHLEGHGVRKDAIAQNPEQFSKALDMMLGAASGMVKSQILKSLDVHRTSIGKSKALSNFERVLGANKISNKTVAGGPAA